MSDWERDNPAGRLHSLLTRLQSHQNMTLVEAWRHVLGTTDAAEFQLSLAEVGTLVPRVRQAVAAIGSQGNAAQVDRYWQAWSRPIFPQDRPFSAGMQEFRLKQDALDALASVAEYLHEKAPEAMPTEDAEIESLLDQVADLIEEVKASDDLPADVKQRILDRLDDVARTLQRLDLTGPGAVERAVDALCGTLVRSSGRVSGFWQSPVAKKARAVIVAMWLAFAAPGTAATALNAWEHAIHELEAPAAQVKAYAKPNGEGTGAGAREDLPPAQAPERDGPAPG